MVSRILMMFVLLVTLASCGTPYLAPPQKGIRGYSGSNNSYINLVAEKNRELLDEYQSEKSMYPNNVKNGQPDNEKDYQPVWGLALSGGGLRSAAFCIGAMKALYDKDYLGKLDIISSVSGGGYASYWLLTRNRMSPPKTGFFGETAFGDKFFIENLYHLKSKGNFVKLHTMLLSLIKSDNAAFSSYEKAIIDHFGNNISEDTKLNDTKLMDNKAPYFILNTTLKAHPHSDTLSTAIEFTPRHMGNPEIGFHEWNKKDDALRLIEENDALRLSEALTISAAAVKFKLTREIENRSSSFPGEKLLLSDGAHSENLAAISLIRRGVKNIIIIDAEHDPDYLFPGYINLKRILREMEIDLTVVDIDKYLKQGSDVKFNNYYKSAVFIGNAKTIPIKPNNIEKPLEITIYYVKMSMPSGISKKIENETVVDQGKGLKKTNDAIYKRNKRKFRDLSSFPELDRPLLEQLFIHSVHFYGKWLNEKSVWRHFGYTFPHTPTADQSYYTDQLDAFVGLGYLETNELPDLPEKTKE
ncbi:MAG: hypothetical protein HN862_14245 [Candidatus Scalindua sp.]|nr:hypothetical protein [Candidatus Scalindua sp.]MBT7212556.1 hypothetical protein [Candidatus Scalindua sp.]MBT7589820.1 hypothetical protein [Candidatus Scalindua sp.]